MARYDRIAPLSAPLRDSAFPAWPVLRDIEVNDRDLELARRARLRFLALRPVRRLLDRGFTNVGRESYLAQIEAVREELGYLPARDAERARLARYLHNIEDGEPGRIVTATLDMANACGAAGQTFGAEEYALTALGLARSAGDVHLQGVANTTLARIYRKREQWNDTAECVQRAVALAESVGDQSEAVRARAELAFAAADRGDHEAARSLLSEALADARSSKDIQAEALAQAKLCACELAFGNPGAALEHGWSALHQLDDVRERAALLEQVGSAFAEVGLHKAAERCFTMVAQRGVDPALRVRARAAHAAQAAAVGASHAFHDRRTALLNDAAEWSGDPRVAAFVQLELGRASVVTQDLDFAREHLREAIETARRHLLADILASAQAASEALENNNLKPLVTLETVRPAADAARRIAAQLDTLPDLLLTTL